MDIMSYFRNINEFVIVYVHGSYYYTCIRKYHYAQCTSKCYQRLHELSKSIENKYIYKLNLTKFVKFELEERFSLTWYQYGNSLSINI